MNKKKIWITVAVCAAALLALAAALRVAGNSAAQTQPESTTIAVETITPARADLANKMDFIGSLSAGDSVAVLPKLTAKVSEVRVSPGDEVKAGDVLFVMDTSDLQSQADLAALSLDAARLSYELSTGTTLDAQEDAAYIQYDQARDAYELVDDAYDTLATNKKQQTALLEANIAAEKAKFSQAAESTAWAGMTPEKAEATATSDLSKAKKAWAANGCPDSGEYFDAVSTAEAVLTDVQGLTDDYNAAKAQLSAYESSFTELEANLITAKSAKNLAKVSYDSTTESRTLQEKLAAAQLEQAQISYDSVMEQLGYAVVTAPADGRVLSISVSENNYASPSAAAVMLGSTQSMQVSFGLPANYFGQVAVGDSALVEATGGSAAATITEVAPMLDPTSGTFTVKAEFVNTPGFLAGSIAKVTLTTQHAENALTVPVDYVRFEDNQPYVYVLREGVAVKTALTLGMTDEEVYEVLGGLSPSDQVISTWHPNLADGAAVSAQ